MMSGSPRRPTRRTFLKRAVAAAAVGTAAVGAGGYWLGSVRRVSRAAGKKVIVLGIDGMDPRLSARMMDAGELPHLARLRAAGGFRPLGTSIPPQSPVAWATFINGAGPGSHGIFDFVHRHTTGKITPFYSAAETLPGEGFLEVGDHRLQIQEWPFRHKPGATLLRRQGVPFWDYLDEAGIPSTFYDLPSNYPPSPSQHGHHRCLSGMGTPDLLGGYGTHQHFSEQGPAEPLNEQGSRRCRLTFADESATARLVGPEHSFLKQPHPVEIPFVVHRDRDANAAVIEVLGQKVVLKPGLWSHWITLDFELTMPLVVPNKHVHGICRFLLQEVTPVFRLYVTPINIDPRAPAVPISEPASFVQQAAGRLGPFYTTGFQEDHRARTTGVFNDDEFRRQADYVLEERLALLEHAMQNYDDGLLFFYFSSSDLQSHIFWWDEHGDEGGEPDAHPIREAGQARQCHDHVKRLYRKLDAVIGDLYDRYGDRATLLVMSDHGFANFGWQFNLNSWLRDHGYLNPPECASVLQHADWSLTKAYGLGINGLYLNLKGREPEGIVEPGAEREELLEELTNGLLHAANDEEGRPILRGVYRTDQVYSGPATALAPDLILGYRRGFRASWETCLGELTDKTVLRNDSAWSADHCADAREVPGVLWCNRPLSTDNPSLVDLAPSILAEYGLPIPPTMTGRNLFKS